MLVLLLWTEEVPHATTNWCQGYSAMVRKHKALLVVFDLPLQLALFWELLIGYPALQKGKVHFSS